MKGNLLNLLIFISVFISGLNIVSAQTSELVIEVKTDKYSTENSWKIFDLEGNLIDTQTIFESDAYNRDTILLDNNICYYWTLYDSYGDGMSGTANNGIPGYKLYFNGELIAESDNPNFGKETSVFSIGVPCSMVEVKMLEVSTEDVLNYGESDIKVQVVNMGREVVTSMELAYSINNEEEVVGTVKGLYIEPGDVVEITHPQSCFFTTGGDYTLQVEIKLVNDIVDGSLVNNILSKNIFVRDGYLKKPLHEIFTSSTCAVCPPLNNLVDASLSVHPGTYSLIKYQVNWPGAGDPYYIPECGNRRSYYNVNGAPSLFVNGTFEEKSYTLDVFEANIGQVSDIDIKVNAIAYEDTVVVNIEVFSLVDHADGLVLHTSVVENTTHNNVATNGETEFGNVLMRMLPSASGQSISELKAGQKLHYTFGCNMKTTYMEEITDLSLIAFVQNHATKEVLQSEMVEISNQPLAPFILCNIENGTENVSIKPEIVLTSTEALRNIDNSEIQDFTNLVVFKEDKEEGNSIEFTAEINESKNQITLLPDFDLALSTSYLISVMNVENSNNIRVAPNTLRFKTTGNVSGVESQTEETRVYPNPASGFINVVSGERANLIITDIAGKNLGSYLIFKGEQSININHLEKGIYVLKFDNGKLVKLVVK